MEEKATYSGVVSKSKHISISRKKKLIAFGWYGGKFSHLDWLLPLLPICHHYCEPFGGSAAVLLNRDPSPVETYNDIDGEVTNFFRVLRDQKDRLVEMIGLTPFSREEFQLAIEFPNTNISDVERARRFYVRARQVRTGLAQTASNGRWANCRNTSRSGMSGAVSRWLGAVDDLPGIAERLIRVQIENDDAISLIQRYDTPETLFYCDPPYPHESRGDIQSYAYEMTDEQHEKLASILNTVKGKVAFSTYRSPITDKLYNTWYRFDASIRTIHSVKQPRQEVLYTNYEIQNNNRLFDREK